MKRAILRKSTESKRWLPRLTASSQSSGRGQKPLQPAKRKGTVNDQTLYKNEAEARQHYAAISSLAEHLRHPEVGVRPLYEIILARFNRTARIRDFLAVLVSRRVKDLMAGQPDRQAVRPVSDFEANRHHREDF